MKTISYQLLSAALCLALTAMVSTGCKSKKEPPLDTTGGTPMTDGTGTGVGDGQPNIDLENMLFSPAEGLQKVYFDYDSYALRPDALSTLSANADKIKQVPGVVIQIAGHCDERGTQEYNLALGERRALSVRDHLINLGVPGDRLITISYGEESPAVMGSGESAWSQNRRAEFMRGTPR